MRFRPASTRGLGLMDLVRIVGVRLWFAARSHARVNVVVGAFFGVPLFVLVHEIAHVAMLDWWGIPARLRGFAMGMPVHYFWNFAGLSAAQLHYRVPGTALVVSALAGPVVSLIIGYGALGLFHISRAAIFWTACFSAVAPRMIGITLHLPRFLAGNIDTSDEAIAAHFLNWPLSSLYWPSLLAGYICLYFLFSETERGERLPNALSALMGGAVGYFSIETLANVYFFGLHTWTR